MYYSEIIYRLRKNLTHGVFIWLCGSIIFTTTPYTYGAYTVSTSVPSTVSYSNINSSAQAQFIYASGGIFGVDDNRASLAGYYATLSVSSLTSGSNTIASSNISAYVSGALVNTTSGSTNSGVMVPTGTGNIGSGYVSLATPVTILSRNNTGGGIFGSYGVAPIFRLNIPAYTPIGTYSGNATMTLIENDGACDPGYTWNGSACVGSTQTVSCQGSIPSNAAASSSTTYTQTWNGSAWNPTTSWTFASTPWSCTFACNSNFSWDGSVCIAQSVVDAYYANAALLLHGEGTNNSTAIIDTGNNGKTVTTYGDAKISNTQNKFGSGSAVFDGNGDYLSVPDSDDFSFGSGNFTIELWTYPTTFSWGSSYISQIGLPSWQWNYNFSLYQDPGWTLVLEAGNGSSATKVINISWILTLNTWQHIAIVRSGSTFTAYVNGVNKGGATYSNPMQDSSASLVVGRHGTSGQEYSGYIDDVRITKGIARYTANFTPPTSALTADANTMLLLNMEGTSYSAVMDTVNLSKIITTYGDAKISTTQSKFGGASASFDGNGDYLTIPPTSDFNFGTGNFTVEFWMKTSSTSRQDFFSIGNSGHDTGGITFDLEPNAWVYWNSNGSNGIQFATQAEVVNNSWHHFALVRNSNTFTIYLDGISKGSTTYTGSIDGGSYTSYIGEGYSGTFYPFNGYLDDVRISKGTARYTVNFTPPTSALTADANTALLLPMDGTNTSTTFVDTVRTGKASTENGNAKISTTQSKFGGASEYFDGNGDYISTPDSDDFAFGSGNFTIEMWIQPSATQVDYSVLYSQYTSDSDRLSVDWGVWGNIRLAVGNADYYMTSSPTWTSGTWYHLSIVRSGNTLYMFKDGVSQSLSTNTLTSTLNNTAASVTIGGQVTYSRYFNGYIDDVRITKGIARYTANFTPSTTALTADAGTALLIHMDVYSSTFMDTSWNGKSITTNGDAKMTTAKSKFGSGSAVFDGNGDYLDIPNSNDLNLWTTWTAEMWAYPTTTGQTAKIISTRNGSSGWEIMYANNQFGFEWYGANSTAGPKLSTSTFAANQWYHVAVVTTSGTTTMYVNGTSVVSYTNSFSWSAGGSGLRIGKPVSYNEPFIGYLDDMRITKGIARYTANFTPPTSALTSDANTVLLLDMDGATNGTPTVTDISLGSKIVTAYGNAAISTTQSKFGGASAVFDGNGDHISIPNTQDLNFGWDNFTIEAFFRTNDASAFQGILSSVDSSGIAWMLDINSGKTNFSWFDSTNAYVINLYGNSISSNTWYHLAVVRNGSNFTLYVNGIAEASGTFAGSLKSNTTNPFVVGDRYGANWFMNGYLDDLRVTRGLARYTSNFTPPTSALTADGNTVLMLSMDGANGSTVFGDSSTYSGAKTITANGDAKVSTTQAKFGSGSIAFDGNGDYLSTPDSGDVDFGDGNFTVEWWVYFNSGSAGGYFVSQWYASTSSSQFYVYMSPSGQFLAKLKTGWSENIINVTWLSLTTGSWYHFALVRNGNTLTGYVNGTSVGSVSVSGSADSSNANLVIWWYHDGGYSFNGYLDNIRVTKGIARYTANFTLPTSALTADANTVLLLSDETKTSTAFMDTGNNGKSITAYGDAKISTAQAKFGSGSLAFDGVGDYLASGTSSDFTFGTNDFTVETWIYPTATRNAVFLDLRSGGEGINLILETSTNYLRVDTSSLTLISTTSAVSLNSWSHIAITRSSGITKLFLNGTLIGSSSTVVTFTGNQVYIGTNPVNNSPYIGHIDDLRITKGIARYTTNFTPPTAAFADQ